MTWGDEWDAGRCANSAGRNILRSTQPVGSFPQGASPYGCLDMAGNVWEWCADRYDADYYESGSPRNPAGPEHGDYRVLRGGSWNHDDPEFFRAAFRGGDIPAGRISGIGFRCAAGL